MPFLQLAAKCQSEREILGSAASKGENTKGGLRQSHEFIRANRKSSIEVVGDFQGAACIRQKAPLQKMVVTETARVELVPTR